MPPDETGAHLGQHVFPEQMLKEAGGDYVLIQVRPLPSSLLRSCLTPSAQYGDLWQTLYEGALDAGAEVITGVEVTKIDTDGCSLTLAHGDVLSADVIIGADGPRGLGRRMLLAQDEDEEKLPKSFVMYECVAPRSPSLSPVLGRWD